VCEALRRKFKTGHVLRFETEGGDPFNIEATYCGEKSTLNQRSVGTDRGGGEELCVRAHRARQREIYVKRSVQKEFMNEKNIGESIKRPENFK